MKLTWVAVFFASLSFIPGYSQNLVINHNFESYTSLPNNQGQIERAAPWVRANDASTDYFNRLSAFSSGVSVPDNFFGSQEPLSGDGYAGIITYASNPSYPNYLFREYAQQKLSASLKKGKTYYWEFYVSLARGKEQRIATDKMGILFSGTAVFIAGGDNLPYTPDYEYPSVITDSLNWTKISGCYTPAADGIQYITIGNFRNNSGTTAQALETLPSGVSRSYYYIDDVSVIEFPDAGADRTINCGDTVNLSVTPGDSYSWSPAATLSCASCQFPVASPSSSTSYVVSVSLGGCTSTDTVNVTVINPFSVSITSSGGSAICVGDTVTLFASGGSSYQWSGGVSSSGSSVSVSPSVSTWYFVTATDSSGCSATDSIEIIVLTKPVVAVSGDTVLCNGESTTLTATGGSSYQWSGGISSSSQSVTVSPSINTVYNVTASNGSCNSDTVAITVTVNFLPVVTVSADTLICKGDTAVLVASGGISYQWSGGGINAATSTVSVSPPDTTTYYVVAFDSLCQSFPDSVRVKVKSVDIAITGNTVICEGGSTALTASGASSYQWSGGGVNSATSSVTVMPVVSTLYTVAAADTNGCSTADSILVSVISSPVTAVTGDTVICQGDTATLTASGGTSYLWSGGLTATTPSITVIPAGNTIYNVTAYSSGCPGDTASVLVRVNARPVITVSNDTLICKGDTAVLVASGGITYQWSGGGINAITSTVSVSPPDTTTYYVVAFDSLCQSFPDSVQVKVKSVDIAINGDTIICEGESTTLIASGGIFYQWGGGITSVDPAITINPLVTTSYNVFSSDGACNSDTLTINVTVQPIPVTVVSGDTLICEKDSATLFATGGSSYQWGDGISAAASSITVSPENTTTYWAAAFNGMCYGVRDSITVVVNPLPVISVQGNTLICEGDTVVLTASGAPSYLWTGDIISADSFIAVSPVTNSEYVVKGNNGRCDSDPVTTFIEVIPIVPAEFIISETPCDLSVVFIPARQDVPVFWDFGDKTTSDSLSPEHNYVNSGTYTVTLVTNPGAACADTAKKELFYELIEASPLYIPNAITVNHDGLNDLFKVYGGNGCGSFELMIFNRWGELIFRTNDLSIAWDGTSNGNPVQPDMYVYILKGKRLHRSGTITVIK